MNLQAAMDAIDWAAREHERAEIAAEARRYAEMYPQGSDGRNTFVIFAEWVEARSKPAHHRNAAEEKS